MCCGSRRSAWRSAAPAPGRTSANPSQGAGPAPRQGPTTVRGPFPSVLLHCLEGGAVQVRGPVTGQRYDFSPSQPSLAVDARDAAVLTRSAAFRHAVA